VRAERSRKRLGHHNRFLVQQPESANVAGHGKVFRRGTNQLSSSEARQQRIGHNLSVTTDQLKLLSGRQFDSGNVLLTYQPAPSS
jgi:hypothetical protein